MQQAAEFPTVMPTARKGTMQGATQPHKQPLCSAAQSSPSPAPHTGVQSGQLQRPRTACRGSSAALPPAAGQGPALAVGPLGQRCAGDAFQLALWGHRWCVSKTEVRTGNGGVAQPEAHFKGCGASRSPEGQCPGSAAYPGARCHHTRCVAGTSHGLVALQNHGSRCYV